MRKKLIILLGAIITVTILGLGISHSLIVKAEPNLTRKDVMTQVDDQYPGKITEVGLDDESKNPVYKVNLEIDSQKYNLLIDGNTGEVLDLTEKSKVNKQEADQEVKSTANKQEKQDENEITIKEKQPLNQLNSDKSEDSKSEAEKAAVKSTNDETNNSEPKSKQQQAKKAVIGTDKARSIALAEFSGTIEGIELDDDDDRLIYEVEIADGDNEAEIAIDAYTGEILFMDLEIED